MSKIIQIIADRGQEGQKTSSGDLAGSIANHRCLMETTSIQFWHRPQMPSIGETYEEFWRGRPENMYQPGSILTEIVS
jgi:hypothetical protein